MADLCNFTLNTRLGSCMIAAAYWSSVRQVRMMKHRVTLLCATSDLVSCIAMEMYSRKVTRRLTDFTSSDWFEMLVSVSMIIVEVLVSV